ncbi:TFIIB-type zinc ribbon-containing protein [Roseovarius pelagicus]|uniref:Zf-TFIIB domain-containing protein n=1 Tax=Roseovarius pelagicus TaxID=2980108 RepID=A0ABY6D7J0_9RHOB|nr:zf-TFIIB domain-containing protein [Roseovarius pelagicus]UXX82090.1 zf-TFIIB domain-containing protein [Roseovarius pelagicus]
MKCPVDGTQLMMTDRAGVEIDYCPSCRGVWLDRGELDKIIERSIQTPPELPQARVYEASNDGHHGKSHKKKRGGFLEELFDF